MEVPRLKVTSDEGFHLVDPQLPSCSRQFGRLIYTAEGNKDGTVKITTSQLTSDTNMPPGPPGAQVESTVVSLTGSGSKACDAWRLTWFTDVARRHLGLLCECRDNMSRIIYGQAARLASWKAIIKLESIHDVAWHPGKTPKLATGDIKGNIKIWTLGQSDDDWTAVDVGKHSAGPPENLCFSPSGTLLASYYCQDGVKIWAPSADGKKTWTPIATMSCYLSAWSQDSGVEILKTYTHPGLTSTKHWLTTCKKQGSGEWTTETNDAGAEVKKEEAPEDVGGRQTQRKKCSLM